MNKHSSTYSIYSDQKLSFNSHLFEKKTEKINRKILVQNVCFSN